MSHNKIIPQIKGDVLLGNLRHFKDNPFQALCDWQRDYGDLVSFRLAVEKQKCAYLPFGIGERICIGNHFALLESQLLLSMIVQQYDVLLLNTDEVDIEMAVSL